MKHPLNILEKYIKKGPSTQDVKELKENSESWKKGIEALKETVISLNK